ncbi:PPP4R4 [Branchiostoma lanceolatum]|uniref:PPP4R4 protein n=2 Tax=Branchiostoma lanceolatum TaxID=7740 RepID=A0A8J9ZS71_BRALA|nr:PPP4R4 [Branchiostoma lanceolatum]
MDLAAGLEQVEDDLQELSLERTITKGLKTQEEIDRLTVDEKLGDLERAVYLLSSGQEVQRISVVNSLPQLIQDNAPEAMRRVVPKVREMLHVAGPDVQLAATISFLSILEREVIPISTYSSTFLQTIIMSLEVKDPVVSNAWLDTLLSVCGCLPKDVIKREILGIAVAKGQLSQSVQSRLASCKILGRVATKFEPYIIKKEILPLVTALCQDIDYEVRGCMCRQLDSVARALGLENTKSAILPELVELANDEECFVRHAALDAVVNLLNLLDDDTCTQTIVPLVCKFCERSMEADDTTLPHVAEQIGRLCHGLSVNVDEQQRAWLLEFYTQLCIQGRMRDAQSPPPPPRTPSSICDEDRCADCRRNAAYNFPAMVLFAEPKNFKLELYNCFVSLCEDPHYIVRRTIACGFHEVAKLLGSHVQLIQQELVTLLNDNYVQVLEGIVPHLPETLESLVKGVGGGLSEARISNHADLVQALLTCEYLVAACSQWRPHLTMMQRLACIVRVFTSDQIYSKFVPVLFQRLTLSRVLPVKQAAGRTLCVIIRHNRRQEHRQELICRLIEALCHSNKYQLRMLFVDVCCDVMELFSRRFFKEYFFEFVLNLAHDPVANVRLKLCSLLPRLKTQIKLPGDRQLLQQLEHCVRRLLSHERDRDVAAAIRKSVFELDKIQVAMETLTQRMFMEEDLMDQKKEEEEKMLLELEEREKKEHEQTKGRSTEKGKGKGSKGQGRRGGDKSKEAKAAAAKDAAKDASPTMPRSNSLVYASSSNNLSPGQRGVHNRGHRTSSVSKTNSSEMPSASPKLSKHSLHSGSSENMTSPGLTRIVSPHRIVQDKKNRKYSLGSKEDRLKRTSSNSPVAGVSTSHSKKSSLKKSSHSLTNLAANSSGHGSPKGGSTPTHTRKKSSQAR